MSKSPLLGLHERSHYPPFNTRGRPVTVCLTPSKFFEFFVFAFVHWLVGSLVHLSVVLPKSTEQISAEPSPETDSIKMLVISLSLTVEQFNVDSADMF